MSATATATATAIRPHAALLPPLIRWRCPRCNTTLAMLRLAPGSVVQIKCYRCNALVTEAA